jgi:hypothetical protein
MKKWSEIILAQLSVAHGILQNVSQIRGGLYLGFFRLKKIYYSLVVVSAVVYLHNHI